MARKRTIEEVESITDIEKPMLSTSLHGAITSLSPVKKGRKSVFFDGMMADETSKVRLVGFSPHQQKKLNELYQKDIPIQLVDCEVKQARQGQGFEVLLKHNTQIVQSPKKIDIASLKGACQKVIALADLQAMDVFEKVTVSVKALCVKPSEQVADMPHQDVIVADHTCSVRASLWGDGINSI